jgi:hypothetical protein
VKLRRIVIAAVGVATLIVAAGVVVSFLPTQSGHSVAQTVLGGAAHSGARPSAAPGETQGAEPRSGDGSKPAKKSTKQDDSLIGNGSSTYETIPTATATPYRLPDPAPIPATIKPADLSVAPDSKVSSKSISTGDGNTQVVIDATTTTAPTDLLSYYQGVFTRLGMTGKPVPAVGGSTAIAFERDLSTVTLTVSPSGKAGSAYVIFGVLQPRA